MGCWPSSGGEELGAKALGTFSRSQVAFSSKEPKKKSWHQALEMCFMLLVLFLRQQGEFPRGKGVRTSQQSLCLSLVSLGLKARGGKRAESVSLGAEEGRLGYSGNEKG